AGARDSRRRSPRAARAPAPAWRTPAGWRSPPGRQRAAPAPRTAARPPRAARAWPVTPPAGGRGPTRRQPAAEGAPLPFSLALSLLWADLLPYLRLKRSTRPAVSTSFCLPVKKGWHAEQISTWMLSFVERVSTTLPQAQTMLHFS